MMIPRSNPPLITVRQSVHSQVSPKAEVLFEASSMFPFDFFPDTITVTSTAVTVFKRRFFFEEFFQTISIKDIMTIEVETNIFFAQFCLWTRNLLNNTPITVGHLRKRDAMELQKTIQGLVIAEKEHIDSSLLSPQQTVQEVQRLVQMHGV